jgi:NhaP-type Na+/H+ and K+/H+ antiporter
MTALISVFVVLLVALVVHRVATVALTITGMSREAARFQARSAISGVGFTTSEAEQVASHPVRRRIVMGLMLVGSAGVVGAVASLMLSFTGARRGQAVDRALVLVAGLVVLWVLMRSRWVDRQMSRLIRVVLGRMGDFESRDYASLLDLGGEYAVMELAVRPDDWLADRTLAELRLRDEGVVVLGIERAGEYLGTPAGDTVIRAGDTLVVYGRERRLCELDRRDSGRGDEAHREAAAEEDAAEARQTATHAGPVYDA